MWLCRGERTVRKSQGASHGVGAVFTLDCYPASHVSSTGTGMEVLNKRPAGRPWGAEAAAVGPHLTAHGGSWPAAPHTHRYSQELVLKG